jgi:hypothetical protein
MSIENKELLEQLIKVIKRRITVEKDKILILEAAHSILVCHSKDDDESSSIAINKVIENTIAEAQDNNNKTL